jgi:hypothetical protein
MSALCCQPRVDFLCSPGETSSTQAAAPRTKVADPQSGAGYYQTTWPIVAHERGCRESRDWHRRGPRSRRTWPRRCGGRRPSGSRRLFGDGTAGESPRGSVKCHKVSILPGEVPLRMSVAEKDVVKLERRWRSRRSAGGVQVGPVSGVEGQRLL